MVRSVIALLIASAPVAAATAQTPTTGAWELAQVPGGCMVHAASPQGTVLSIWAFAGQEKMGVLVQNKAWSSLEEGQDYQLKVSLGEKAWPVEATGRTNIDADGPGLFFSVAPGKDSEQAGFFEALASAKGMNISGSGAADDTVPLARSREAMVSLARCLGDVWAGREHDPEAAQPTAAGVEI